MALNEEKFKDFINSCRDFNSFVGTKVRQVHEGTLQPLGYPPWRRGFHPC